MGRKKILAFFLALIIVIMSGTVNGFVFAQNNDTTSEYTSTEKQMLHLNFSNKAGTKIGIKVNKNSISAGSYKVQFKYKFATGSLCYGLNDPNIKNSNDYAIFGVFSHESNTTGAQMQYVNLPGVTGTYTYNNINATTVEYSFNITQAKINSCLDYFYIGFYISGSPEFYLADMVMYKENDNANNNLLPKAPSAADWKYGEYIYFNDNSLPAGSSYIAYDEDLFAPEKPAEKQMLHLNGNYGKVGMIVHKNNIVAGANYTVQFKYHFKDGILFDGWGSRYDACWDSSANGAIFAVYYKQTSDVTGARMQYSNVAKGLANNIPSYTRKDINNYTVEFSFDITSNNCLDYYYIGFFTKNNPDFYIADMVMYKTDDLDKKNILSDYADASDWAYLKSNTSSHIVGNLNNTSGYETYNEDYFIYKEQMLYCVNSASDRSGFRINSGVFKRGVEYTFSFKYKLGQGSALLPNLSVFGNSGSGDSLSGYTYIICPDIAGSYSYSAVDECVATYSFVIPDEYIGCSDYHIGFDSEVSVYLTDLKLYESSDYDEKNILPDLQYLTTGYIWESASGNTTYKFVDFCKDYFISDKTVLNIKYDKNARFGLRLPHNAIKANTNYTVSFRYYFVEGNMGDGIYFALMGGNKFDYICVDINPVNLPKFDYYKKENGVATYKFSLTQEQINTYQNLYLGFYTASGKKDFYISDFTLYETNDSLKTNRLSKNEFSTSSSGWDLYNSTLKDVRYVPYGTGDANADNLVDIKDLVRIKKTVSEKKFNPLADINEDNSLNAMDLADLQKQLLNADTKNPNDYDWISVHGANLSSPAVGYAQEETDALSSKIINSANTEQLYKITGTKYYFSSKGSNSNNGLSPNTPFKTLDMLDNISLKSGDAVLLERNSVFRVYKTIDIEQNGITIGCYGVGEKPRIYASPKDFAVSSFWSLTSKENVWKASFQYDDACGMFFNHGEEAGALWRKSVNSLSQNGDFHFDKTTESVFLYFDKGNPADYYRSIEILPTRLHILRLHNVSDAVIDSLCIKFTGGYPIIASGENISITNCEIGYTGGSFNGTVRYGNAIELSGKVINVKVENNWIYQIFDSAITWQGFGNGYYDNISFSNNLLEYNNADIEFFERDQSTAQNFFMENNIMRFTSMGWGTQDEEGGIRGIEGCVKAHTNLMDSIGNMTFKNNIMDCPARDIICWRILPENKSFIDASANKVFIKSSYRTNDIMVRGLVDESKNPNVNFLANSLEEAIEAFKRLSDDTEIYWFN